MTPEQLKQLLTIVEAFASPFVRKTGTNADNIGLELLVAVRDSPAMLNFIIKRFNNPTELAALAGRLAS